MSKLLRIKQKVIPQWVDYASLSVIVALAVILRSVAQFTHVFQGHNVIFREVDPFYQMRLIENMAFNNFKPLHWDMYALYPNGVNVGYGPVMGWLVNGAAYIGTFGGSTGIKITTHMLDIIGAWLPVVAAAAVVVVVYFLGKEVFKFRFAALFGALLVAIIPSEFLHRSLLGFTDHHVFEVLFSSLVILCLIKAIRLKSWAWGIGAAGAFGLYALNWIGWPILAAVIVGWAFVYYGIKQTSGLSRGLYFVIPLLILGLVIAAYAPIRHLAYQFVSNTFLGFASTIQEAKPVSIKDFYLLYGISGAISLAGIYLAIKNKVNSLFLAWSIFMIAASIAEKRWGYYSTIGIGMLAAYAVWWVGNKARKDWKPYVLAYCCIAIVFTNYPYSMGVAKRSVDIPPDWLQTCQWLGDNTPPPFGTEDAYYQQGIDKPSYGIFTWWDYGAWIVQISHRVPLCSPTQQESPYYSFFTLDNETRANAVIQDLNVEYVIIDSDMVGPKFYAIWDKVNHGQGGWQESLKSSMVYQMYYGEVKTWKMIRQNGAVKVFAKTQ